MKSLFNIRKCLLSLALISFAGLSIVANAGGLGVNPVNLVIDAKSNIGSVKLTNQSTKQETAKIEVMKWEQKDGKDVYTPTTDLVVTPPVAKVPAQDFQLLRVGLVKARDVNQEMAYRLFINEVPNKTKTAGTHVNMVLHINMPIFVKPAQEQRDLHWTAKKSGAKDVVVKLANKGNVHAKISKLQLFEANQEKPAFEQSVFTYVLPKQHASWNLKLPKSLNGTVKLVATTDNGEVSENIVLAQG